MCIQQWWLKLSEGRGEKNKKARGVCGEANSCRKVTGGVLFHVLIIMSSVSLSIGLFCFVETCACLSAVCSARLPGCRYSSSSCTCRTAAGQSWYRQFWPFGAPWWPPAWERSSAASAHHWPFPTWRQKGGHLQQRGHCAVLWVRSWRKEFITWPGIQLQSSVPQQTWRRCGSIRCFQRGRFCEVQGSLGPLSCWCGCGLCFYISYPWPLSPGRYVQYCS